MVSLLEVRDLDKSFFATHAARSVSFDVHEGEIVSLLGENGAGKSTVIKMLAGVYRPDSGSMRLAGEDLSRPEVRRQVSFVHQTLGLIEWMTVAENIAQLLGYPRRRGLISRARMDERARTVLAMVGGGIDPAARVFDLPRTERNLLAIARALVTQPRLLVLDEPTASLPAADVERLFTVLRRLRDSGVGMIYVSHRLDEIYQISSRTVVMRSGQVVGDRAVADLTHHELVDLIVGHDAVNPTFDAPGAEVQLSLRGVVAEGVGPVSLDVRRGEVVALCGLRGAGHAEIGRVIAGAAHLDAGSLTLDGRPFTPRNPAVAVDAGVGFATSNRETEAVGAGLTVRENLFLNPKVWGRRWWQLRGERDERRAAHRQTVQFGVRPADTELSLDTLSGGNQQKVILARWFGVGRKVIVLEEPSMGVDVGAKVDIYEILRDAARDGTAAIVVSTDMEEVTTISHRAVVFGRGRVVDILDGDDLTVAHLVAAASDLTRGPADLEGTRP
jgi:ribose transport system ATP-binding protein